MPPSKSINPKRAIEQHIQAWFVKENKPENDDLPVVEYFNKLREKGWSPKRIIGHGIMALSRELGDEPEVQAASGGSVDQTLQQIWSAIDRIRATLETTGIQLDIETQQAINTINTVREEFTPIQESFVDRPSYKWEDDDD